MTLDSRPKIASSEGNPRIAAPAPTDPFLRRVFELISAEWLEPADLERRSGWDVTTWHREPPPFQAVADVLQCLGYQLTITGKTAGGRKKAPQQGVPYSLWLRPEGEPVIVNIGRGRILKELLTRNKGVVVTFPIIKAAFWPKGTPPGWRASIHAHAKHLRDAGFDFDTVPARRGRPDTGGYILR